MKELVKNTSIMGSTKVLVMVIGIIRNKYLAVKIGAEGYGVYNLLMSFFHLGDILAGTSLGGATLKYMAEYNSKGEKENVEVVFNISFFIVFLLVSVVTIIFNIFFNKFRSIFLSPEVTYLHYGLFSLSYFFNIIGGVFEAGVKGLIKIKDLAKRSIISSVVGIISLFICVHFWGLNGFFLNLVLVSMLSAVVLYQSLRKSIRVKIVVPKFTNPLLMPIMRFSFADIFSSVTMVGGDYLRKKFIVSAISLKSLGLFSAASSFTNQLSIVSASAQSYMFPKMSEDLEVRQRDKILSDYTRLVSLSLGLMCPVIVLFGHYIIKILYSSEFVSISSMLHWFLISIIIQSIQVSYLWTVYGMARLKVFTYTVVGTDLLSIVLAWMFISKYGIIVLPISNIICASTRIIIWAIYLRKHLGVWLAAKAYRFFVLTLGVTFLANLFVTCNIFVKAGYLLAVVLIIASIFSKREYRLLFSMARSFGGTICNKFRRD